MPILLPADTRAALGDGANRCESVALLQQKFPFIDPTGTVKQHHRVALDTFLTQGAEDFTVLRNQAQGEANHQNPNRATKGKAMLEALKPLTPRTPAQAAPISDKWLHTLSEVRRRQLTLATASRLIVGHANGVIENSGLTLHRSRGVPVIPGAAVKNVALRASLNGYDYDEQDRADLFGNQKHASRISYLDAIPANDSTPTLEYEINTPHYMAYYSGNGGNPGALDTENPVPVVFPAVAAKSRFTFTIVLNRPTGNAERDAYLLDQAESLLHEGLTTLGLGAKTSSGHGFFLPDVEQFEVTPGGISVPFCLHTPAITAGARQTHPELRVASIRGQLRQTYRMLSASPSEEHALFGGIGGNLPSQHPNHHKPVASAISLRLEIVSSPPSPTRTVPLCPHEPHKGQRTGIVRGSVYRLIWRDRFAVSDPVGAKKRATEFSRVLTTWLLLGGIGCRSTRAAGSVGLADRKSLLPLALPAEGFASLLADKKLPNTLRFAVLGQPNPDPEALRKIATNTLSGLGHGDPLGYVNPGRKVSPLKLKVGLFSDGYRLIAVWDNRNDRGGDLRFAINRLVQAKKPLGELLAASSLAHAFS